MHISLCCLLFRVVGPMCIISTWRLIRQADLADDPAFAKIQWLFVFIVTSMHGGCLSASKQAACPWFFRGSLGVIYGRQGAGVAVFRVPIHRTLLTWAFPTRHLFRTSGTRGKKEK
jgi:hypothetical protein